MNHRPNVTCAVRRRFVRRLQGCGRRGIPSDGMRTAMPPRPEQGSVGSVPVRYVPSLQRAVASGGGWSSRTAAGATCPAGGTSAAAFGAVTGRGGAERRAAGPFRGSGTNIGTGLGRTESGGGPARLIGFGPESAEGSDARATRARGTTADGGGLGAFMRRNATCVSRGALAGGGGADCAAALAAAQPRIASARRMVEVVMGRSPTEENTSCSSRSRTWPCPVPTRRPSGRTAPGCRWRER